MGLSTTPARESAGESVLWAIVHNAAARRRDLELRIRWPIPRDVQGQPSIAILSPGRVPLPVEDEGRMVFRKMEPLENRWVGIRIRGVSGKRGLVAAVEFEEMLGDAAINGFGLGIRLGSDREVAAHAHERLRSVATRLVYGWKVDAADLLNSLSKSKTLKFPETEVWVRRLIEQTISQNS